jgi:hypothetical protein
MFNMLSVSKCCSCHVILTFSLVKLCSTPTKASLVSKRRAVDSWKLLANLSCPDERSDLSFAWWIGCEDRFVCTEQGLAIAVHNSVCPFGRFLVASLGGDQLHGWSNTCGNWLPVFSNEKVIPLSDFRAKSRRVVSCKFRTTARVPAHLSQQSPSLAGLAT